ncbi:MAG: hypothetical protein NC417_14565 [Candidatus Gastranaerophilales bacterium]|nr:hypothetical protein [Candidatus Gastranaerophilales bacterium]
MERRFIALFLAGGLILGLCGCGSSSDSSTVPLVEPEPIMEPAAVLDPVLVVGEPDDALEVGANSGGAESDNMPHPELVVAEMLDRLEMDESLHLDEYFTPQELVDMMSAGEITMAEIECCVATGNLDYGEYEEILRLMGAEPGAGIHEAIKPSTNFWDYPELNNVTRNMIIKDAISFSEGVAWITVGEETGGGNTHVLLINTSGEVLYCYNDNAQAVSYTHFAQGVSLLEDGVTDEAFLINTSGDVVWSKEKGISDIEAIYGAGSVESIEVDCRRLVQLGLFLGDRKFNGYLIVKVHVNTFERTCDVYAVIKPDGTWLFDPLENKRIYLTHDTCCSYYDDNKNTQCTNLFSGETVPSGSTVSRWLEEYKRLHQEGLLYNEELQGFTDDGGNVVIDCSGYKINSYYPPKFYNGYCVLAIKNPDGADYITVIDTDGNQLFAPIKNPSGAMYGCVSDGYFVMTFNPYSTYDESFDPLYYQFIEGASNHYIALDGEVYESEYADIYPFSDGYSLVNRNGYHGDYIFVDTNFQDAFPQSSDGQNNENGQTTEKTYITMNNFSIEGKWKSVGSYGFGQAQPGAIVAFDGTNCNFFSPSDTYAFYADGDNYRLECTSFMSTSTAAFTVKIIDADHIDVYYGDNITELQRSK